MSKEQTSFSLDYAATDDMPDLWKRQDLINNRIAISMKQVERTTQELPIQTQELSTTTQNLTRNTQELNDKMDKMQEMILNFFSQN